MNLSVPTNVRGEISDIIPRHMLGNELGGALVVSDKLVPATSPAIVDVSADGMDDNTVSIWSGPSFFDPANFLKYATLLVHVLFSLTRSVVCGCDAVKGVNGESAMPLIIARDQKVTRA